MHNSAAKPAALRASVQTFHANSQLVLVPVTVTDHNAQAVEGLRAEDFIVLDEQIPQQILSFTSDDVPCSVGLILDISGSMQDTLGTAKDVAHTFFKTANPEDEFLLLTASSRPATLSGFTDDIAALEKSIELTKPAGKTALIDTVYLGLRRMREARRPRRALLVLSDGMDNYSRYSKKRADAGGGRSRCSNLHDHPRRHRIRRIKRYGPIPSSNDQETRRPRGRAPGR